MILKGSEYKRVLRIYYYNKYPNRIYFQKWNLGHIESKNIEESKIFNQSDIFYIKENNPDKITLELKKKVCKKYLVDGDKYTLEELSEKCNIHLKLIKSRLYVGKNILDAIKPIIKANIKINK